jgi:hypothetical protein
LQKGIKSKEDVERLLNRGIIGPDGVTRKYAIDYNSDFDGVVISSDDYYEHSDYNDQGQEVDSRTGQTWGPHDYMEFSDEDLSEGLTEVDRRGFLKGLGAAAVAGAAGGTMDAKAQDRLKIAVEVGELDTSTKEYESVSSGQARNFVYLYDSSQFVMQWIDGRGNKISEPEVFQAKGTFPDFKNRPTTMYIGTKNAVKVVPNGSPEGDMIYFTPRNWIDQKIGWRSVYYQMFSKVRESVKQGVAEGDLNELAPGAGDEGGGEDPYGRPQPRHYNRSVDFFGQFEADHFDREDFDDATGVFKGYWGDDQIAYFKFDNPQRNGSDDPGMGWYYEPQNESVAEAQTDYQKRRQRERDVDAGRPVKPLPKNPQTDYAKKRAKDRRDMELGEKKDSSPGKITKSEDPCWTGYHMVGKKKKNGREVPNCVPGKKG